MCKRKLTIEQEIQLKDKYESGYQVKELMNIYGFKTKKNFIPLNLIQGENGIWSLRSSDERNMMLLYVHVYYSSFGMQRKYNKFVKRFREHNGRD